MLCSLAAIVLVLGMACGQTEDEDAAAIKALNDRIAGLVQQLSSDEFTDREAASQALAEIGLQARAALETAAKSSDPETALRAKELLERLPKITHTVVDALGAPIPLARVVLQIAKRTPGADVPIDNTPLISIADELGRVSLHNVADASVVGIAVVEHARFGRARVEVELSGRTPTIRLPLVRQGTDAYARAVTGVVVDADGRPVADAAILCGNVRTPGQGLINPSYPLGSVLSDAEGRFAIYLPGTNPNRERGELIPEHSKYSLRVTAPDDDSLFPLAGMYANDSPVRLQLQRATRQFRFLFESPGGGVMIADGSLLRDINIQHETVQGGERSIVTLERSAASLPCKLVNGKYLAELIVKGDRVRYEPITVNDDSPKELVFRLPKAVTYSGRVVQGIDGKPLADAFVMGWNSVAHNNLALLTPDEWKALRDLPANPPDDAPALRRLRELYGVRMLVCTDAEGRFQIVCPADREFYGLLAFGEDLLPYKITVGSLKPDDGSTIDVGELPLFPAAKLLVRPVFEGERLSVAPHWLWEQEAQPEWFGRFRAADQGHARTFESLHWLKLNESQPLYVPAGVRLRMKFDTPYDDKWAPAVLDKPVELKAGETHDAGDLKFAACLEATVKVVDGKGLAVEGLPVRRKYADGDGWSVAHNTDKDGLAYFHLRPNSRGQFRAFDPPGQPAGDQVSIPLIDFNIQSKPPGEPLLIRVTQH